MDSINHKDRVVVSIPAEKLDEFKGMVVEMLESNVIPGKKVENTRREGLSLCVAGVHLAPIPFKSLGSSGSTSSINTRMVLGFSGRKKKRSIPAHVSRGRIQKRSRLGHLRVRIVSQKKKIKVGAEHHEQTAECLNLLVSLRHWKQHWCQERESLEGTFRQRWGMKLKERNCSCDEQNRQGIGVGFG